MDEQDRRGIFQLSLAEIAFIIILFLVIFLSLEISSLKDDIKDKISDREKAYQEFLREQEKNKEVYSHLNPNQYRENHSYSERNFVKDIFDRYDSANPTNLDKQQYLEAIKRYSQALLNGEENANINKLGLMLLEAYRKGELVKKRYDNQPHSQLLEEDPYFQDYFNQIKDLSEAVANGDAVINSAKTGDKPILRNIEQEISDIYLNKKSNISLNEYSTELKKAARELAKRNDVEVVSINRLRTLTNEAKGYPQTKAELERARRELEEAKSKKLAAEKELEAAKDAYANARKIKSELDETKNLLATSNQQLAESRKKANYLQGRLSKSGFGYPPCWIPAEGEPTRYVLKVTVNNPNSVTVVPAWPDDSYRIRAEQVPPFMQMIARKHMSMADFLALGNEVNNYYVDKGTDDECRYFVILDNNQITDRKAADLARYRVSSLFYIYESR